MLTILIIRQAALLTTMPVMLAAAHAAVVVTKSYSDGAGVALAAGLLARRDPAPRGTQRARHGMTLIDLMCAAASIVAPA